MKRMCSKTVLLKAKIIIIFLAFFIQSNSQNLVANASFEDTSKLNGDIVPALWQMHCSVDYYNYLYPSNEVHLNIPAGDGNAYIGMVLFESLETYREYVFIKLRQELKENEL